MADKVLPSALNPQDDIIHCPICLKPYPFKDVEISYRHIFLGADEIIYLGLCSECYHPVIDALAKGDRTPTRQLERNIPKFSEIWVSVASEVAMIVNNDDFKAALTNGHGLSRSAYEAVKRGDYIKSPFSGPNIMLSWED